MDFPIADQMDEDACSDKRVSVLHPDGLTCPRCHASEGLAVHRQGRDPVLDDRGRGCDRVFNSYTGTAPQGTHRSCAPVLPVLRGICQGVPTAALARELGCDRKHLLGLRHKLQGLAPGLAEAQPPLPDAEVEADEMYQNAGKKASRIPTRPTRPGGGPTSSAGTARSPMTGRPWPGS